MRRLLVEPPLENGTAVVAGDEAHHARNVLRLGPGDRVWLHDGDGRRAEACVESVERHRLLCLAGPPESVPDPPAAAIEVALPAPKGSRFDDVVRSLVELGVGAISPLRCERGERVPKLERARRVAREALKQCGRGRLPQIGPVADIPSLARRPGAVILLDPAGAQAAPGPPGPVTLVVGPEGGFTSGERSQLLEQGAVAVRVASPILRIETAAVAATAVWASAWEREHGTDR